MYGRVRSLSLAGKRPRIAALMSAVVVASVLWAPPVLAAPGGTANPDISQRSVPTTRQKPVAVENASVPQWEPKAPVWPAASSQVVELPTAWYSGATGAMAKAAGSVVSVARPAAAAAGVSSGWAPDRVSVEVFDQSKAKAVNLHGVLFRVRRADAAPAAATVVVQVDASGFADAFGGDWASRLRMVTFPDCVLTTPEADGCSTPRSVESSTMDNRTRLVSAQVPVGPAPGVEPESDASQRAGQDGALASDGGVFAVAAAPSSDTGDFSKTPFSASYQWASGTSSGSFSYSYPMGVPPVPGGLKPSLGLSYDSGAVDGQTAGTNVQPGVVGEGWDLSVGGYIERSYRQCSDDVAETNPFWTNATSDLCWRLPNARLVWGGKSTELIFDASDNKWRPADDDGEKVELLTGADNGDNDGEHWRITATDGTRYTFGLNHLPGWTTGKPETNSAFNVAVFGNHTGEPCFQNTNFQSSRCYQTYRWNLDYAVDVHNNSMSYFYTKQTQRSGLAGNPGWFQTYERAGQLDRIEYGTRAGSELANRTPPAKVEFGYEDRCADDPCYTGSPAAPNPATWPDTPWDLFCYRTATTCPDNPSPTFWTDRRLTQVTTSVWTGSGDTYNPVDEWNLTHDFPSTNNGTKPVLWLRTIVRTGKAGGSEITLPEMRFEGGRFEQRADYDPNATMAQPMKFRINQVKTESGARIDVSYRGQDPVCQFGGTFPDPDNNSRRCFPKYFKPASAPSGFGWYHKYNVQSVTEHDLVAGSPPVVHTYEYYLDATTSKVLWGHDDGPATYGSSLAWRSWGDWRGYTDVVTTTGATSGKQTQTRSIYMRGLRYNFTDTGENRASVVTNSIGTNWTDHPHLRGHLLEQIRYASPGGQILAKTIYEPNWTETGTRNYTAEWTIPTYHRSHVVRERTIRNYDWITANNAFREATTGYTYDTEYPFLVKQANDLGDATTANDDRCATSWYSHNIGSHVLGKLNRSQTVGVACTATPVYPGDALSDTRTYYDGSTTHGAAPTKGLVTKTESATSFTGSAPNYITTSTIGYDGTYGRPTSIADPLGRTTTTTYTVGANGLDSAVKVRNPMPDPNKQETTTTLDPTRGLPITATDPNGKVTTVEHDAMGRTTKVWLPGQEATETPNAEYAYSITKTAPSSVESKTLNPAGGQISSFEFFDGLLRPRQTQQLSPDGKTTIADTKYDDRGAVSTVSTFYDGSDDPGATLRNFADSAIESQTRYAYDGLGRQTYENLWSLDVLKWGTVTTYGGDRVNIDPPNGGTPTTTITDARGRTTAVWQYTGAGPSGTHEDTAYAYDDADRLTKVTDAAGNHWDYTYDLLGRSTKTVDPDAGTSTSVYDNAGQLTTSTDGRGEVLWRKYDQLGRQTELRDDSATGALRASWTYDTLAKGLATSSSRIVGSNSYTTAVTGYDDSYQPTGTTVTIPATETGLGGTYATAATYKVDGSPATVTLPAAGGLSAETLTYGYNASGFGTSLTSPAATYVEQTGFTFDAMVSQRKLGAGTKQVQLSYGFEPATRRLAFSQLDTENQNTTETWDNKASTSFGYQAAGNLDTMVGKTNGAVDQVECFKYDHQGRMTNAWTQAAAGCTTTPQRAGVDPYQIAWTYDVTGNRKTETTTTATGTTTATSSYPNPLAARPHGVRDVTYTGETTRTDTYDYDNGGNTTTRNVKGVTQTLTWDAEGHLESTTQTGENTTYVYDADGNRLLRRDSKGTTLYLGNTELRRTIATGQVDGTRYYDHNGDTIAVRGIGGLTWLAADHHDTNQISVNPTTLAVSRKRTLPFGEDRTTTPTGWPTDRGFVGGTLDPTGLIHIGAREYDAKQGRFISVDPLFDLTDPQSWNGYAYANNNPATYSDPSGLMAMDDGGLGKGPNVCYSTACQDKPPPPPPGGDTGNGNGGDGGSTKPPKTRDDAAAYITGGEATWDELPDNVKPMAEDWLFCENNPISCAADNCIPGSATAPCIPQYEGVDLGYVELSTLDKIVVIMVLVATLGAGSVAGRRGGAGASGGGRGAGRSVAGEERTAPKPLGRGSTGRTEPQNLHEQLALEQTMLNPRAGSVVPMKDPMGDSRWPWRQGWVKMEQKHDGVTIHYVRNIVTGDVDDFKIK